MWSQVHVVELGSLFHGRDVSQHKPAVRLAFYQQQAGKGWGLDVWHSTCQLTSPGEKTELLQVSQLESHRQHSQ